MYYTINKTEEVDILKKEFKVFFSWQADLPSNQTKSFIEECIATAKKTLPDSIELIPDEATRNRFGSPDIMDSIYEKISECDLFIADVSIVGEYTPLKNKDEEDNEIKYFPNPNVLLELGYASGIISWDRCICFANTKYGELGKLPFDLNHRRITGYSYEKGERKATINRIAEIIRSTVIEYIDTPLPKKNFSHHIVGGFNFESGVVEQRLIPYNTTAFDLYNAHTQKMIYEIKNLIDKISEIHLPSATSVAEDFDELAKDMTVGDIMKDPVLSKAYSLKLTKAHPAKVDKEFIYEYIKRYYGIEINDDFCNMGNLQVCSPLLPFNETTLEGTDDEKEKYDLLQKLEGKLSEIELREMYLHVYDDVIILPLAITNISQKSDERISINIKVINGMPVEPKAAFFNSDYEGLEGCVYDEHLVEELLKLPENGLIKYDSSFSREIFEPQIPHLKTPVFNIYGGISSPGSDSEDYEQELQDYVQSTDEGANGEYSFTIGALRPNETVWLDKVMLIKPVDRNVTIEYSIKSNNTTGQLSDTLTCEIV